MATKTQALQDALKLCIKEMCNYCRNEAIARGLELTCVDGCEAYKIAQAALALPLRNCDRFHTGDLKRDAQDAMEAMLDEGVPERHTAQGRMERFLTRGATK